MAGLMDEDERHKPKASHEIGQELSALSVAEIDERISLLCQEIERLRADKSRKEATKSAADAFFKL